MLLPRLTGFIAVSVFGPLGLGAASTEAWATPTGSTLDGAIAFARQLTLHAMAWVETGYARAPAIMIGLAVLLVVPPLSLLGLLLSRRGRPTDPVLTAAESFDRPRQAWIEVEGADVPPRPLGRSLVRIGRQDDNEIRLGDATVHRYHAVIERTGDADYVITDVSGPDGNGVRVNGARVGHARLVDGDLVQLGAARLRFATAPG